jgi:RNA polymerase sigma factor for flagellar operon FliA
VHAVEERTGLIDRYLSFARMLAAKAYARRTYPELEFDDYMQYASIGLLEAVDRFDPGLGVKFEAFAAPRITGAILDGIASLTEKQEQVRARQRIVSDRVDALATAAPDGKDAHALFAYPADMAIGLAIGFALDGSGIYQAEEEAAYDDPAYRHVELQQLVRKAAALLDTLPDTERRVMKSHYQQQRPFQDIAADLGLTKGRVAQIHKSALARLRAAFGSGIDLQC